MCREYNGWSNYETWNANLWITNEEGLDNEVMEQCKKEVEYCIDEGLQNFHAIYQCGQTLKNMFEEAWFTDIPNGPMGDAINSYLSSIEWAEIGKHYYEAVMELIESEKETEDDGLA
jgi:hypothetical protein